MAVPKFILLYISPIIFIVISVVKTFVRTTFTKKEGNDKEAAAQLDGFQRICNERLLTRKRSLISDALTRLQSHLDRPLRVLDAGSGTGANFAYFPPKSTIVCVDPNPNNDSLVRQNVKQFPGLTLEGFYVGHSENLKDVDDSSVDAVVSTYTLCTVEDIDQCLREFLRVLRPGGKFIFLEHVADSGNTLTYLLQSLLKLMFYYVYDKCCINRPIEYHIRKAGFKSLDVENFYADELIQPTPVFPEIALVRSQITGVATK